MGSGCVKTHPNPPIAPLTYDETRRRWFKAAEAFFLGEREDFIGYNIILVYQNTLLSYGVFGSAFVELILDRIDFVRINLVRIDFEVK